MINLIPNKEKKEMVRDFYLRLVVVFLMVLGFSILIASVVILPAYFTSSVTKSLINARLDMEKGEPTTPLDDETLSLVSDLENKLNLIENNQKNKFLISEIVISEIVLKKLPEIKITEIIYDNTAKGKTIKVNGTAPNREQLLIFKKSLEDSVAYKEVSLPPSSFVQGSDIKFSLNLIPS